jgi:hypothetical protein
MRRLAFTSLALALACSRETPAPPAAETTAATATTASVPTATTATSVPELQKGTYDEAMLWLRSAQRFEFVIDEGDLHAEGTMTRKTPGAEKVTFRANGEEWTAEATAQGVTWKRAGKPADAPAYGSRLYQRVTLAFDPQKKEGVPLLVATDGPSNLYRFTNANTGEVHEVWVRKSDSSIERMKIGESAEIKFAP